MSGIRPNPIDLPLGPVIVDLKGLNLDASDLDLLQHPLVGGVIFFSRNFESREQIQQLVADVRAVRPDLLLAVDQEGGRVQRFKTGFTPLPPMQLFWQQGNELEKILPLVQACGWLMASEILACDIDISFAPVLDVDDNHCEVIANRSFAPDPYGATQLAGAFIEGMREAGMACTGKHFPGHGGVVEDSHLELPIDERHLHELRQRDMIPFAELSDKLDAVMPAHLLFPAIHSQAVGFSPYWLKTVLREELGFKGIIFSDDLTMAGAASVGSYGDRAEMALAAGCDAVLVCNNPQGAAEVLDHLQRKNITANNRLAAMRRTRSPSWDELQANPRWQAVQSQLVSLVQSPI